MTSANQNLNNLIDFMHWWTPEVPLFLPKKSINSDVRIACIVENKLYQGLQFECEIMHLTPSNWKLVLEYWKPDFILIESFRNSATDCWNLGQDSDASFLAQMKEVIKYANLFSIPSVFWMTKGCEYHQFYKNIAAIFDFVYCADPKEIGLLKKRGVSAKLLLPCVQPAIYNPFREIENYNALSFGAIFDGWADLDRMDNVLGPVLEGVKPYGLTIIESRYQIPRNRAHLLQNFKEDLLGCVTEKDRSVVLKYAPSYITCDHTLSTTITQQWMSLEACACRLPLVHYGALDNDDLRKNIAIDCNNQLEFCLEFVRFQEDDLYRERIGHLGWRNVLNSHTFSHRVRKICNDVGVQYNFEQYPKVSVVTSTYQRNCFERCIDAFNNQTYPNKELILVFNGNEFISGNEIEKEIAGHNIKITQAPNEMSAGACMNQGYSLADGKYCFKFDDGAEYGENYIFDMVLLARSIDATLFGKPATLSFDEEDRVYEKKDKFPLSIFKSNALKSDQIWLSENSISGEKSLFDKYVHHDTSYAATDTLFLMQLNKEPLGVCAVMDRMNFVSFVGKESTHFWKMNCENLKQKNEAIYSLVDFMV